MDLGDQLNQVFPIRSDDQFVIYTANDGTEVIVKPGTMQDDLSNEDIRITVTNPQGGNGFAPQHEDLFDDFVEMINVDRTMAGELLKILEEVFAGEDPEDYLDELTRMDFGVGRFSPDVFVFVAQLMMIEQEINFRPGERNTYHDPPRDLLMGCIRWIFTGEYDKLWQVKKCAGFGFVPFTYRRFGSVPRNRRIWKWQ